MVVAHYLTHVRKTLELVGFRLGLLFGGQLVADPDFVVTTQLVVFEVSTAERNRPVINVVARAEIIISRRRVQNLF